MKIRRRLEKQRTATTPQSALNIHFAFLFSIIVRYVQLMCTNLKVPSCKEIESEHTLNEIQRHLVNT